MATDKNPRTSISLHPFQHSSDSNKGPSFVSQMNMTGSETAEDLIVRYNEQFKEYKKTQSQDSLSLVGEPEDIARVKECRRVGSRRTIVVCSLGLWVVSIANFYVWMGIFYIWPTSFVQVPSREGEVKHPITWIGKYPVLICFTSQPFLLGSWGLIGAFCGRDKVLKGFFLTAPYIVLISFVYLGIFIYSMSVLSPDTIERSMDVQIGQYYQGHIFSDGTNPIRAWDKLQTYLKCCGISSKQDWLKANIYEPTQKVPGSCCRISHTNKPIPKTDKAGLEKCIRTGGPAWERGCKAILFSFYQQKAILATAFNIATIIFTILGSVNGVLYYRFNKQLYNEDFKYTWNSYLWELIPIKCCIACCCLCLKKRKTSKTDPIVVKSEKSVSTEEASVLYKNPIAHMLSHTEVNPN